MLDNLEKSNAENNKETTAKLSGTRTTSNNRKQKIKHLDGDSSIISNVISKETPTVLEIHSERKGHHIFVTMMVLGSVVLITACFIVFSGYYSSSKDSLYSSVKSSFISPITQATAQSTEATPVPTTTPVLHKMYYSALDNLNQGHIQETIKKLKTIIHRDPKFTPAREKYNELISRYILGG